MPVLTMSTVTPTVVKSQKRFQKVRQQRNHTHSMMNQINQWKTNAKEALHSTIQEGWERHNQAMQKGLSSQGNLAHFEHTHGNTSIQGTIGAHDVHISPPKMGQSQNSLTMTLADMLMESHGENWDVSGALKVGDINASINHRLISDNINFKDGLANGPQGSASGNADAVHLSGTARIGTDASADFGVHLQADIDASWGARADIHASMSNGIGTPNIQQLHPEVSSNLSLVIDHQNPGTTARSELANIKFQNGKFDVRIKWNEVGNVIKNSNPFMGDFNGGLDIV